VGTTLPVVEAAAMKTWSHFKHQEHVEEMTLTRALEAHLPVKRKDETSPRRLKTKRVLVGNVSRQ
jgi:hypothetical protein